MPRPRVDFTNLDRPLREMRAEGLPIWACAANLGVGRDTAQRRCRALGINAKLNHGTASGTEVYRRTGRPLVEVPA